MRVESETVTHCSVMTVFGEALLTLEVNETIWGALGVAVATGVAVEVNVAVGVDEGVSVNVAVIDDVTVTVGVEVFEGVNVGVIVGVLVEVGVGVFVAAFVGVNVLLGVRLGSTATVGKSANCSLACEPQAETANNNVINNQSFKAFAFENIMHPQQADR